VSVDETAARPVQSEAKDSVFCRIPVINASIPRLRITDVYAERRAASSEIALSR